MSLQIIFLQCFESYLKATIYLPVSVYFTLLLWKMNLIFLFSSYVHANYIPLLSKGDHIPVSLYSTLFYSFYPYTLLTVCPLHPEDSGRNIHKFSVGAGLTWWW